MTNAGILPEEKWAIFFDQFSIKHRGHKITIKVINSKLDEQELIKNAPLLAMIYDRPGKGDNLAIEVGIEEMTYAHTINAPITVSTTHDDSEIIAIQITDSSSVKTVIMLDYLS